MTVRPARIFNSSAPSIFSFVHEHGPPALVIGAWKKSLIVQLGRPRKAGREKFREIGVADVFAPGQTVHLVISVGPKGTTVFVDDRPGRSFPGVSLDTSETPLGRLLLGNAPTGGSPWQGDILALTLYDRALTLFETASVAAAEASSGNTVPDGGLIARYRFDKRCNNIIANDSNSRFDIVIPRYFTPLRQTFLQPHQGDVKLTLASLLDIFLNILGFIPFGFLAILLLCTSKTAPPGRQSAIAVFAGFALSLFIELTQDFIPARSSSLTDLATNTLGCAIGVLLYFMFMVRKNPAPAD